MPTEMHIAWPLGKRAWRLVREDRVVRLSDGEDLRYDGLIPAGDVWARRLFGAPAQAEHVRPLRSLDDCRAIDQLLERANHLAVVGGGLLGCELASTCRQRVLNVTILDVASAPMTRALGTRLGTVMGDLHKDHDVDLHLGVAVYNWQERPDGVTLRLASGERIDADMAVVAIGTTSDTDWLEGSGP